MERMSIALVVAMMIAFFCLLLHVTGLLVITEWLLHRRDYMDRTASMVVFGILLLFLFSMMMTLHLVDIVGNFYYSRGWFDTRPVYSLGSYTITVMETLVPRSDAACGLRHRRSFVMWIVHRFPLRGNEWNYSNPDSASK